MKMTPRPDDPYIGLAQLATDQQLFVGANSPPKTGKDGANLKKKESKHERLNASKQERMKERVKVRKNESKHERMRESGPANFPVFLRPLLEMKAVRPLSFRYPHELIEQIEEIKYAIRKRHGKKVTKNAILITALAFILWDYEQHGKDSTLFKNIVAQPETWPAQ